MRTIIGKIDPDQFERIYRSLSAEEKVWYGTPLKVKDDTIEMLIDDMGTPVAYTKASLYNNIAVITYLVDSRYRNQGYASNILDRLLCELSLRKNIDTICASVHIDNKNSIKLLESFNFKDYGSIDEIENNKLYILSNG